jgi:hypothetical protein
MQDNGVGLIEAARRDLEDRTLAHLHGGLAKLVYLSATRDYNTGEYQHDGLAERFGAGVAQTALGRCHDAVFRDLLETSLAGLVAQLEAYIESTGAEKERVIDSWRRLGAYRVLIPAGCDPLSADYFVSNLKIALEALRLEAPPGPTDSPAAPPSP